MAVRPTIDGLFSLLEQAKEKSISGRFFVRPSRVHEILSIEAIENAVAELDCEVHERIGLSGKIHSEAILLFAVLICMRREDHIGTFRDHECLQIPMSEAKAHAIAPGFGLSLARENQWQFTPYVFRQDMADHHRNINDTGMILPFIAESDIDEGGFGEISKLAIPTCLQEFYSSTDESVVVIRKRIKRRKKHTATQYHDVFKAEMQIVRLLHRVQHPNIIPLLGSYTFDEKHNFLFPVFEMDLRNFFEQKERFGEFVFDYNFPLALCGLASALEYLHHLHLSSEKDGLDFNAIGYHHDFRPANILVSKNSFILTDFGLSRLKPTEEKSETPWKAGAGDYIAPECMNAALDHQPVGRAIDVWAFGCLITEVVTYMDRGPEGLLHFRQARLEELQPGLVTTYFFGKENEMKNSVRQWFDEIESTSSTSTRELLQIASRSLDPQPGKRCLTSQVRRELSTHSLGVLLSAVLDNFAQYGKKSDMQDATAPTAMQAWFEEERLGIFRNVLMTDRNSGFGSFPDFEHFTACRDLLSSLLQLLQLENSSKGPPTHSASLQIETQLNLQGSAWERIQMLIQQLWELLPPSVVRQAQSSWLQSLRGNDIDRLNNIDSALQFHKRRELVDLGALAHMRALQLQLLNNPTSGPAEFFHARGDLDKTKFLNGHSYGTFKTSKQVLVEWMYYRPEWTKIPQEQRLAIMKYRAKDFNSDPKPCGLRILKCLGFVEQKAGQSRRHGYGFIYELPSDSQAEPFVAPVTLRQLLLQGADFAKGPSSQAPLRGRYLLAHALAQFFEAFYTVGCLHESFNSNTVIFTPAIDEMLASSQRWAEPYVVGFQKCRPDDENWATEGPSDDRNLQDYEHPDYEEKGRYVLEYDYYRLGLVLLEIGLWRPLQEWSTREDYRRLHPSEFRNVLLDKYVPRLTATVGDVYRHVVRICLDRTLERNREEMPADDANAEISAIFAEEVLRPLEELSLTRL